LEKEIASRNPTVDLTANFPSPWLADAHHAETTNPEPMNFVTRAMSSQNKNGVRSLVSYAFTVARYSSPLARSTNTRCKCTTANANPSPEANV